MVLEEAPLTPGEPPPPPREPPPPPPRDPLEPLWLEGRCPLPDPVVRGGRWEELLDVDVDVEVVEDDEDVEDPEEVLTLGVLGVVLEVGVHDSEMLLTGPTLPGTSADGELPAGTSPLNVSVCPVSSVTVTVQLSAEAVGKAAIAMTTSTKLVVPRAILSLRLLDTLAYLLPPCAMQS